MVKGRDEIFDDFLSFCSCYYVWSLAPFQKKARRRRRKKKKKIIPTHKKRMRNNNTIIKREDSSCPIIRAAGLIALGMIVSSIQESWYYSSSPSTNFDNESANWMGTVKTYSTKKRANTNTRRFDISSCTITIKRITTITAQQR